MRPSPAEFATRRRLRSQTRPRGVRSLPVRVRGLGADIVGPTTAGWLAGHGQEQERDLEIAATFLGPQRELT